jgi:hypothetical protein
MPNDGCGVDLVDNLRLAVIAIKPCGVLGGGLGRNKPDNQDAVLRWNACARIIIGNPSVKPDETDNTEMLLDSFDRPH